MKAFYRVEISDFQAAVPAKSNGSYYNANFKDGVAYLDWRELGEHETDVAVQALGHDPRFRVIEIRESDLPTDRPKAKKRRNAK